MKPKAAKIHPDLIQQQSVRIAVSRADFRFQFPTFYKTFDTVDQYHSETCPTLAVMPMYDGKTKKLTGRHLFFWNANYVKDLSDKQVIGVQMHELLHILFEHTTKRCPKYKIEIDSHGNPLLADMQESFKQKLWNIACDLSINPLIKDWMVDPFGMPDNGVFPNTVEFPWPSGRNAEYYYEKLLEQHKDKLNELEQLQKAMKALDDLMEKFGVPTSSSWVDSNKDGQVTEAPATVQPGQDEGKEDSQAKESVEEVKEGIGTAKCMAAGNSGKATKDYLDISAGRERKTPGWMKKTTHASVHGLEIAPMLTRKTPNRRFGMLFPGSRRKTIRNKVLVAVDVSSSIDQGLLNVFSEHLNNMTRFADFDMVFFNTQILDKEGRSYDPKNASKAVCQWKKGMKFRISGGTDFEPLMRMWDEYSYSYDSLFIFTDGCASYSKHSSKSKQINWILYGDPNSYKWYWDQIKHGKKFQMTRDGQEETTI